MARYLLPALVLLVSLAGCAPSYRIVVAQKADWKTGGSILHGWVICDSKTWGGQGMAAGCISSFDLMRPEDDEGRGREIARIESQVREAFKAALDRACPRGWQVLEDSVPGWSKTVATPEVHSFAGTVSFYECKP